MYCMHWLRIFKSSSEPVEDVCCVHKIQKLPTNCSWHGDLFFNDDSLAGQWWTLFPSMEMETVDNKHRICKEVHENIKTGWTCLFLSVCVFPLIALILLPVRTYTVRSTRCGPDNVRVHRVSPVPSPCVSSMTYDNAFCFLPVGVIWSSFVYCFWWPEKNHLVSTSSPASVWSWSYYPASSPDACSPILLNWVIII